MASYAKVTVDGCLLLKCSGYYSTRQRLGPLFSFRNMGRLEVMKSEIQDSVNDLSVYQKFFK